MPPDRPRLIVVAGPNGSGKTSITEKVLAHAWFEGCEYINPDFIARDELGDWNNPEVVLRAANLAEQRRYAALSAGRSLAFETVFSSPEKLGFVRRAMEAGYFVRLFFICTESPAINAARVAERVMEGGHDVPISKIISRYSKSISNCSAAARFVDCLYLYDNSVDDRDPELVLRMGAGEVVKRYRSLPNWAAGIVGGSSL